jgi:hypothetical protein
MLTAYGPFSVAFEPLGQDRNPYMSLLWLKGDSAEQIIHVIRAATTKTDAEECTLTLLRDVNWRPQLVGAIAARFLATRPVVEQTWRAVDAGSWVSPQLAAVLSLVDPTFVTRATDRLASRCELKVDADYMIDDPAERHSAQGPLGSRLRTAKTAAALQALLDEDVPTDRRVAELHTDAELQSLIAHDVDHAAGITLYWRSRLLDISVP